MNVLCFFNSDSGVESRLAAYFAGTKYYATYDALKSANSIEFVDVFGLDQTAISALIAGYTASSYHRVINLCATATGVDGKISAAQISGELEPLLIGSSTSPVSDDKVITIVPAQFPASLIFSKNQAQVLWDILFSYKTNPVALALTSGVATQYTSVASAGGNSTLTDSGMSWTADQFKGMYLHIIAGTGVGQYALITSNTATQITRTGTWGTNPDTTSMYQITSKVPKPYPIALAHLGGGGTELSNGTATSGNTSNVINSGAPFTAHQYQSYNSTLGIWDYDYAVYIYAGKGAGQVRRIFDNSTTALQVYDAGSGIGQLFSVAPDSTSKYVVVSRQDFALLYEYLQRYLWVYATDPTSLSVIAMLNKLFNNGSAVGAKTVNEIDVEQASLQDLSFLNNVVIPAGKAMYDAEILNECPIYPKADFTVLTSGTLIPGKTYYVYDWITPDDFTNVGGPNADDAIFVALGVTPTTWTNSSVLIQLD